MIGKVVRARAPGLRTIQGLVIGERMTKGGWAWVIRREGHRDEAWNKLHCEEIKRGQMSTAMRKTRQKAQRGEQRIYGDGDC